MEPKVSIICVTYNHSQYIKQALDSFVSQKTDFPFVAIVADDCSNDGTAEIIKEYSKKYPHIIKPIIRNKNIGSIRNFIDAIHHCNTEFIAFCDGDDYWTSNKKLQKQIDFLKINLEYSICFHQAEILYEGTDKKNDIYPQLNNRNPKSLKKLLEENYIPSNSVIYRFSVFKKFLDSECFFDIYPCDWYNHILCALEGHIGFIKENMSIYRWNKNGISYTTSDSPIEEIHLKYGIKEMNFFDMVNKKVRGLYPEYYREKFLPQLYDIIFTYCKYSYPGDINLIKYLKSKYQKELGDISIPYADMIKYKKKYQKCRKYFKIFLFLSIVSIILFLYSVNFC